MSSQSNVLRILGIGALTVVCAACDVETLAAEELDATLAEELDELGEFEDVDAPASLGTEPAALERVCATMSEHIDFGGDTRTVDDRAYIPWIGGPWNDQVSSVQVSPGCVLNVYEHKDFRGAHTSYLGVVPWVGDWWNDRISSYTCDCQ